MTIFKKLPSFDDLISHKVIMEMDSEIITHTVVQQSTL